MADVSVKMGVSGISQFRQGLKQAQDSVKTIDAALKKNEAQFKATGNAQDYMGQKTDLLKQKLASQKTAAANASQALAQMVRDGVDPASAGYQKLARTMLEAEAAAIETETQLNSLGTASTDAAKQTDNLESSLQGLNKKVSLQQVITGINSITTGLENAAKKAVDLGKSIFDEMLNSARWADDVETMAQMYEVPLERYLQMEAMVASGMDTSVDAILGSMSKLRKGVGNENKATMDTLRELGLVTTETIDQGFGRVEREVRLYKDADDLFWKAGKAIMSMGDAFDKEAAAQAVFGKSWRELIPLFTEFENKGAFDEALEGMNVNTEDEVKDLAALNDAMQALEHDFDILKNKVLASLAPALTKAAEALSGLLDNIIEYTNTPEGQKMLEDLGKAVEGLFSDLSQIDPQKVVEGFTEVFTGIVDGMKWLVENKDTVIGVLEGIVIGWGALKLGGGALQILNLINGIKGFGGPKGVEKALERIANSGNTPAAPAGEAAAAGTAGKAGFGAWLTDALGISGWGALGGLTISAGVVYFGGKAIANLNDIANQGREVATDENRYANLSDDQKEYLQGAVRALQHEKGGSNRIDDMLLGLAGRMGGNLMEIFDYTNTSGQKRNKLADMLEMDDVNAAMAAAMIQAAGVDTTGLAGFDNALGKWNKFRQDGMDDWTAAYTTLAGLGGFFDRSGTFVNGKFTIPGFEGRRTMSGGGPNPWELSGYAMTSEANKPKWLNGNLWWSGYGADYSDRESEWGKNGTWDPSELTTKTDDLETSFNGLNEKVPVTDESIEHLGEKSVEAEGHVGEFGERAGGAEGPVTDLGTAASSAASALASIKVPIFLANPHANGIPYVPFDGYGAILHKGERVVPAREAAGSRSYNSNLYIESMYMNNGTDAEGLAAAMAAAQRRTMSGYGS